MDPKQHAGACGNNMRARAATAHLEYQLLTAMVNCRVVVSLLAGSGRRPQSTR